MAFLPKDIKYYLSTNGLGGQITTSEVVSGQIQNVFDRVTKRGSIDGEVNYRCIYIRNKNGQDTLYNTISFLLSQTPNPKTRLAFGTGTAGINNTEQVVIDENTAPVGVTFIEAIGENNGINLGNLAPDAYIAVWLRRTVEPNTTATILDSCILRTEGEVVG